MTTLSLEFGTDPPFASKNAFGGAFPSALVRSQLQASIDNAILDGSLSILLDMPALSDLAGQNVPGLSLGMLLGSPILEGGNPTAYVGTNDLDWWYRRNPTTVDGSGDALSQISGAIVANQLDVGPATIDTGIVLGGAPATLHMSSTHMSITTGASTAPTASGNGFSPGHLPSEQLSPSLTSFQTMGQPGASTAGKWRGNVSAASLAAIPIPAILTVGNALPCTQGYSLSNSMLDLIVSGCNTFVGLLVAPTQPDEVDASLPLASQGPFTFFANAQRLVTTCRNSSNAVVSLADCLDAAAYSMYFKFTSRRVILTEGAFGLDAQVTGGTGGALSGPGISCPGDCSERFLHGAAVALTATPNANFSIASWTGCDSVIANVCNVSLTAARSVSVTFGAHTVPGAPTGVSAMGGLGQASVSFSPPASNGGSAILSYTASCTPGPVTASGASSPITVGGLTNGQAYSCSVAATNAVGTGPASASANVTPGAAPSISSAAPPGGTTGTAYTHTYAATGSPAATFSVTAGALPPGLALSSAGQLSGTPTAAGSYSGTVTASNGVPPDATQAFSIAIAQADPPRLGNISTRMQVRTGNDVMIGGFVIGGSANKTVVVRARGPSLIPFGITNALANPVLQVVRSSDQQAVATNDDWQSASNAADITASGFAPGNALESAALLSLAPGAYTAIVSGLGNTTGVGIVEVFEVDGPQIPLVNISTRGQVLTGNDVMIGGFVVQGGARTVVVRARGPSLIPFGITNALGNPTLQLVRSSDQSTLATNDDWQSASNAADVTASGFAPSHALESAILITLQPGAYTAIVSGIGGGTGVGIVEVFTVP